MSDEIKINPDIPQTMSPSGLEFLGQMARAVPENGVIVEVGPLYGSSTWVLAHNSHPSVRIFSIDTWEPAKWIDKWTEKNFPQARPFGLDAFKYYTRDCPNVTPIQGWSPDVVRDTWQEPIDLFFDDASHGNPGFINNLVFFEPFVKPGGILCGDDFASGSPDIVDDTSDLAARWGSQLEVIGRVWAVRKPRPGQQNASVYGELHYLKERHPKIEIIQGDRRLSVDNPLSWVGSLHVNVPMNGFRLTWSRGIAEGRDLEILSQCRSASGATSGLIPMGQDCVTPDGEPIVGVRFVQNGRNASDFMLSYQAGLCYPKVGRGSDAFNTSSGKNGRWLESSLPFNALRLFFRPKAANEAAYQSPRTATAPEGMLGGIRRKIFGQGAAKG